MQATETLSLADTVLITRGLLILLLGALSLYATRRERDARAVADRGLAERERVEQALR